MRIGALLLLVLACGSEPAETCPSNRTQTSFTALDVDCPELGGVWALGGADPIGSPLDSQCSGQRIGDACAGTFDLVCQARTGQRFTFVGSLRWEGQSGHGDALLAIADRECRYAIESHH
jgi:hypothetical protein